MRRIVALLSLLLVVCSCGASPTAVPLEPTVPAETPIPTATPVPTGTPTATPTETPTQIPTEVPTEVPTATPAPAAQPARPPYGAAVFGDGGNLVYLEPPAPGEEDALLRPLTNSGWDEPIALSPDGRRVLFFRTDEDWRSELWVVNTDGTGETRLLALDRLPPREETDATGATVTVSRHPYSVAWLPDNRTVALNSSWHYDYGLALADDLWLVDTETLALTELFAPGLGGEFAFSPDGSWLLLVTPGSSRFDGTQSTQTSGRVDLVRPDGTGRQALITFPMINTASEYQFYPRPYWLPDGSGARVLVPSPAPWEPGAYATLWAIAVDPPTATELGRIPGNFLFQPDPWSPDFGRLAYVAQVGDPGSNVRELYLADGGGRDALLYDTGEPIEFAGWSPSGERFLYLKGLPGALYLGQIGRPPQQLLDAEARRSIIDLAWLDGDRFLYLVGQVGAWDLRLGAVDGSGLELASPADDFPSRIVVGEGSP